MEKATFAGGPVRYARATLAGGCFWCIEAFRTGAEIPEGAVATGTRWSIDAKPIPRPQPSEG